jgi:hypothetical protein
MPSDIRREKNSREAAWERLYDEENRNRPPALKRFKKKTALEVPQVY